MYRLIFLSPSPAKVKNAAENVYRREGGRVWNENGTIDEHVSVYAQAEKPSSKVETILKRSLWITRYVRNTRMKHSYRLSCPGNERAKKGYRFVSDE